MKGLMKYGLWVLLLFSIFLSGCSADKVSLSPDEEQVMVSLCFSSSDNISSRGFSDSPGDCNAENFLKTLRILVFSSSGGKQVVYNKLFTPAAYQIWTVQLHLKPGIYTFHVVANESSCMKEDLKSISDLGSFYNLPCMKQVKREDGMIRDNDGNIEAFLMKGEAENVYVHKPDGRQDLIVDISLERLLAKVEMRFENSLPSGMTGGFESFSLGAFPRYFSCFKKEAYPASAESGDVGKEWRVDGIDAGRSYVYYIPPYTPSPYEGFAPYGTRVNDHRPPLEFIIRCNAGGFGFSHSVVFRESNTAPDINAVNSNYHYKYVIRLTKFPPQGPLEVQCTVAPWVEESVKEYYVDDCCNLKIEEEEGYTKFILQHVEQDPVFEFPSDRYSLQIEPDRGYDSFVKRSKGSSEQAVASDSGSVWNGRVYVVSFINEGSGKAVLYIRSDYHWLYGRCYFNGNSVFSMKR